MPTEELQGEQPQPVVVAPPGEELQGEQQPWRGQPVVGAVVAAQPYQAQGAVQGQVVVGAVVAAQPHQRAVQGQVINVVRPEAAALDVLRSLFVRIASLDGDASSVTREEFAVFCASPELRLGLQSPDAVFACLDVDKSGDINLDELLYAVAGRYMAATSGGAMDPIEACRQVLSGLDQALAAAPGKKLSEKALKQAHVESSSVNMEGHGTGVTCGELLLAALLPCYVCCHVRGMAVANAKKLVGMAAVMDYVIACRDSDVKYRWVIICYHWETHSDGDGGSTSERVNTHRASMEGMLASVDSTPTFQPNLRKPNVALWCELDSVVDGPLRAEYDRRKNMFYQCNTRDVHQEKIDLHAIPPGQKSPT